MQPLSVLQPRALVHVEGKSNQHSAYFPLQLNALARLLRYAGQVREAPKLFAQAAASCGQHFVRQHNGRFQLCGLGDDTLWHANKRAEYAPFRRPQRRELENLPILIDRLRHFSGSQLQHCAAFWRHALCRPLANKKLSSFNAALKYTRH